MEGLLRRVRGAAARLQGLAAALCIPGADGAIEEGLELRDCPRPVLLLHGTLSSRRGLEVLARRLRRDGYGVFLLDLGAAGLSLLGRGIDDLAELVRARVERIYARHPGLGPLTLIGHSKGGLIATYYVKKLGGWHRTRAVVTLGTPHRGTPLAILGLPLGPLARSVLQTLPGSAFLARLNGGAWPAQVRLVSMWSRRDGASPYPSCLIETHGLPQLSNVEVEGDHRAHLVRKRTYDLPLRELRAAEAQAPIVRGPLTAMAGGRSVPAPPPSQRSGAVATDAA